MPVFTVQVFKQPNGLETPLWANTYHVEAADIYAARDAAVTGIVPFETGFHSPFVYFKEARISTTPADGFTFITEPINAPGTYATSGDQMPKFLALRLDLKTTVGRGGRKFYHVLGGEDTQANGRWVTAMQAQVINGFTTLLTQLSRLAVVLVNEAGTSTYDDAAVYELVTQHQFKRKWARRKHLIP